ncbi:hypothetical protein E8A66_17880 [Vibrio cholerae]|nr:hypothetical protein [Vibrio cholerae]
MKVFEPRKSTYKLPIFTFVIVFFSTIFIVSLLIILKDGTLVFDFSYNGLNNIFIIFKFPIYIFTALSAILAIIIALHKSEQTKLQIELLSSQNEFSNYYKHLEEFVKYCEAISERLNFKYDFRVLHKAIFDSAGGKFDFHVSQSFKDSLDKYPDSFFRATSGICPNQKNNLKVILRTIEMIHKDNIKTFGLLDFYWGEVQKIDGIDLPCSIGVTINSIMLVLKDIDYICRFDLGYKRSVYLNTLFINDFEQDIEFMQVDRVSELSFIRVIKST